MAGKPYAKYIRRAVGGTAVVLVPSCSYVAYKYRPRASFDVDYHETLRTNHDEPSGTIERWLYKITGNAICGFVTTIFTSLLKGGNTFEVIDREKLDNLVVNDRPDNTPLITVANHISCLDDPGMVSALFPLPVCFSHDRMRWGICTEEICFSSPGLASFFAMGKALPVQRGGSIHQKGIATLQDKLNRGDWVHVFPEGRVWQEAGIPLRDEESRWCSASGRCGPAGQKVGPMKWGVGKLIANSYPKTPIVLPFFHMGMQDVLPQDDANQLMGKPIFFANTLITVKIGDPIPVSDLIAAYHTAARQRAEARNIERAARLRLEEVTRGIWQWNKECRQPQDGRSGPTSTSGGGGGWLSWLWPWPTSSAAAPASAAASAAPPLPSSTSYDARLRPVNTVEDYADHTGSSARIAGLTTAASKQPVNTVEMYSDHSGASAHVAGITRAAGRAEQTHDQHALRGGRHNTDDKDLVDSLVREARDTADRLLSTVESEARESSERMISAAIEAVTEAEAHAEHVSNQARVLMTRLKQLAEDKETEAKNRIAQLSAEGEREAVELSQRIEREARSRLPPLIADHLPAMPVPRLPSWWPFRSSAGSGDNSDSSSNNAASGVDGGGGASDDATRHAHSVSWPAPQRVPWPPGSPAPAPAIAAGSGGDSTSDTSSSSTALYGQAAHAAAPSTSSAASSSASSPAAGGGAGSGGMDGSSSNNNSSSSGGPGPRKTRSEDPFPLSDEPVIEVVPTRRLKTGTQVPLYVEAPLRIKPPDHEWLTASEAEAEEGIRLQLYSDIAARVGETLAVLERDVMAHRQARGWTERRPMK